MKQVDFLSSATGKQDFARLFVTVVLTYRVQSTSDVFKISQKKRNFYYVKTLLRITSLGK